MDCSTAHITREDDLFLEGGTNTEPLIVNATDYGYWIYVPGDSEEFAEVRDSPLVSPSLKEVLKKAWRLDAVYIKLDSDGAVHDDLPTYEW